MVQYQQTLKTACGMKQKARQERSQVKSFHLCELSRKNKWRKTENRLVIIRSEKRWEEG